MAERKIVVPEGMIDSAYSALESSYNKIDEGSKLDACIVLAAALRWLSENPIVPSEGQERSLDDAWTESKRSLSSPYEKFAHATAFGAVEWQRHMFLAPEREIPEEIKDLLFSPESLLSSENERIIAAYRRGQKSGKQ